MSQYRVFSAFAWAYMVLQAFLVVSEARGLNLYPPFKAAVGVAAGLSYACTWLFLLWVFRFFRQGGLVPWVVGCYALLCFVDPGIDITHSPVSAAALRNADYYTWFRFAFDGFQLILLASFLTVTARPIRWRCRWTAVVILLSLTAPLVLSQVWKGRASDRYMPYAPLLALLPVLMVSGIFRKTSRAKSTPPVAHPEPPPGPGSVY